MHMADALLTPAVAGVMYAASAVVAGASIVELHKEEKQDLTSAAKKLPTMAVMSALVFAGQMINYTIPGTGSSGHLCGGLLLTSVLGPWAGFLSMIVILTIQCLFFADGGLLALGANVWNMAFYGCFVGYFLIYRPLMRSRCFARRGERAANRLKITLASVLGCALTLEHRNNIAGEKLCFRPLNPMFESGSCIVWKKYQVFSKAAEVFRERLVEKFAGVL